MLTAEEFTALDDFRFKKRMPSRAAAIRELLKRGLTAEGFELVAYGTQVGGIRGARQNPKRPQSKITFPPKSSVTLFVLPAFDDKTLIKVCGLSK